MIDYRLADKEDIPQLLPLLAEIMQHHGVAPPATDKLEAILETILSSSGHSVLVAESQGRLLGMCALIFSYSTWSSALVCELQDVVVTEPRRGESVGRGLVDAAESVARERGCSRLFLLAEAWNLQAHAFYRGLGLAEKTCLYFERGISMQVGNQISGPF
jgi:N-acetylglutamate synthase-like GNAT family acetyltransferase